LIRLDDALTSLSRLDERQSRIIELRFFHEMTQSQIASEIGISQMHVSRLLRKSLATMRGRIQEGATDV
jgi:RNA polymerase sigma-B factor